MDRRRFHCLLFLLTLSCRVLPAGPMLSETSEKKYSIDPTSKIDIRNVDGSILIYGAPTDQLEVWARKRAFNSERLSKISVDVSVQRNEVLIDTKFPPRRKWGLEDRSGTVDYIIVLPWTCSALRVELNAGEILLDGMRCGVTEANLGSGRMFAHNCFTDLRAQIGTGGFDASWEWWEPGKLALSVEMKGGNIRAHVPPDAGFHLAASSVTGKVAVDLLHLDRAQEDPRRIDIKVGNAPQAEVSLKATNGNILVSPVVP